MTPTHISSAQDVVSFLKAQHEAIKAIFDRVESTSGREREDAFVTLRRLLALHETAEEEVVHPRTKHEIRDGERIAGARLHEENEAKHALASWSGSTSTPPSSNRRSRSSGRT